MTKDEALKLALESLDNSIDTVWNEYLDDWRHGLLTRKLQLDAKLKMAEAHKKAITAIKEALEQPEQDMNYWYFRYHETLNKLNSVLAQPEQNLTCKSTQARLAACWRYVKAQPEQEQEPECPECKAVMLYECVACSNNNYPPRREWVGLTQDEQQQAYEQWQNEGWGVFYNAMEAKLKEKNT
jgi:hypothetical protein